AIGNRIFGCDDCLAVCPWNKFAQAGHELKLSARHELQASRLADLARLDDTAFRKMFSKSPIKRTGRNRFVRNVLIAIGNSSDATLAPEAIRLLADPSALVRGAAVWAVSRLLPAEQLAALAIDRRAHESEPLVADEWTAALAATAARWRRSFVPGWVTAPGITSANSASASIAWSEPRAARNARPRSGASASAVGWPRCWCSMGRHRRANSLAQFRKPMRCSYRPRRRTVAIPSSRCSKTRS